MSAATSSGTMRGQGALSDAPNERRKLPPITASAKKPPATSVVMMPIVQRSAFTSWIRVLVAHIKRAIARHRNPCHRERTEDVFSRSRGRPGVRTSVAPGRAHACQAYSPSRSQTPRCERSAAPHAGSDASRWGSLPNDESRGEAGGSRRGGARRGGGGGGGAAPPSTAH